LIINAMTADLAISIRELAKKYRLYSSPGERLKEAFHPFRKAYHREFWALKEISFDVPRGEFLGILGRNGSGKSTLLQIIASVLQPTSGSVVVNGRVAAILELGAGFNPEFTGRENVMLNGAILGLAREQMLQRMESIMAFADIGAFFDQPMKTYSSGMFMRVAFAAAISVDPDILIIDEALAVGDAKFQNKCFDRIASFQQQKKTIILVSHNINLVSNHCSQVLLLDAGRMAANGEPRRVVDEYVELLFGSRPSAPASAVAPAANGKSTRSLTVQQRFVTQECADDNCPARKGYNPGETRIGDHSVEIIDYLVSTEKQSDVDVIRAGDHLQLLLKVRFHEPVEGPVIGFAIKTVDGIEIYGTNTFLLAIAVAKAAAGEVRVFAFAFSMIAKAGDYFVDLGVAQVDGTPGGAVIDVRRSAIHLVVVAERAAFTGLADLMPKFSDFGDEQENTGAIGIAAGQLS